MFRTFLFFLTCNLLLSTLGNAGLHSHTTYVPVSSPFEIQLDEIANQELPSSDYVEIQKKIRQNDITELLKKKYERECKGKGFTSFEDFFGRCTKSIHQNLIDLDKGFLPKRELIKIGDGGNRCVVCYVSFNGKYPYYVTSLVDGLKETGFNGYFLYYIGGWPNPTGKEIRYIAVPYSFKIFTFVDAYLSGFDHVLWIDSACYPLRNIEPLFEIIERNGALLNWFHPPSDSWRFIFPSTQKLLQRLTRVDVLKSKRISSGVMGIKMNTQEAQRFVKRYYKFAQLGYPFLSCFPEEFVFAAIINDGNYPSWTAHAPPKLLKGSITNAEDSLQEFDLVRKEGVFFYHRKGR